MRTTCWSVLLGLGLLVGGVACHPAPGLPTPSPSSPKAPPAVASDGGASLPLALSPTPSPKSSLIPILDFIPIKRSEIVGRIRALDGQEISIALFMGPGLQVSWIRKADVTSVEMFFDGVLVLKIEDSNGFYVAPIDWDLASSDPKVAQAARDRHAASWKESVPLDNVGNLVFEPDEAMKHLDMIYALEAQPELYLKSILPNRAPAN